MIPQLKIALFFYVSLAKFSTNTYICVGAWATENVIFSFADKYLVTTKVYDQNF